jgi:tRNA threonylcarbamoyladenosine biosynthesis protein TsaE
VGARTGAGGPNDAGAGADEPSHAGPAKPAEAEFGELDEAALALRGRALGASMRAGDVVLLHGPMGAGKTTLTRTIAVGLGVLHPGRVQSPTFTLCMVHRGRNLDLVHVDLFRLAGEDDEGLGGGAGLDALGLDDLLADSGSLGEAAGGPAEADRGSVQIVEWGSRWRSPPADHLAITLTRTSPDRRRLSAAATGPRAAALLSAWAAACETLVSSSST